LFLCVAETGSRSSKPRVSETQIVRTAFQMALSRMNQVADTVPTQLTVLSTTPPVSPCV